MAKSSGYESKGERRNVARRTILDMRADRRANPDWKDVMKSEAVKAEVIRSPRGSQQKELADRYIMEQRIEAQAWKLLDQYGKVGMKRAAAIQAVKTNFVEQLHMKWSPLLKEYNEKNKSTIQAEEKKHSKKPNKKKKK